MLLIAQQKKEKKFMSNNIEFLREKLDSILNSYYLKAIKYINYRKVVLGTGLTAELYNSSFEYEQIGSDLFIDDYKPITTFHNKPVYKMEQFLEINKKKKYFVLAACLGEESAKKMADNLSKNNLEFMNADAYILSLHKDKVLQIFDWLQDDLSKKTYYSLILRRIGELSEIDKSEYTFSINESYLALPRFRQVDNSETIVDIGAYVGDSIEAMIWKRQGKFKKIYAFEPDSNNLKALRKRINRLSEEWGLDKSKFIIEACGVGEKANEIRIAKNKTTSSDSSFKIIETKDKDSEVIKITTIDDYFKEEKVTILKADIESMEYNMLLGAEKVIKRDKPAIAICIYHNPSDMYRIPHLLKSYNPDYKLDVRQHYDSLPETVLYCY